MALLSDYSVTVGNFLHRYVRAFIDNEDQAVLVTNKLLKLPVCDIAKSLHDWGFLI